MGDFKKRGGFGGDRGGFGGNRGGFGGDRGDRQMFDATCAKCGKPCQVPFRPNGEKPVYCNECFGKNKAATGGPQSFGQPQSFQRKSFGSGSAPAARPAVDSGQINEIRKQLEALNLKLDTLTGMLTKKNLASSIEKATKKPTKKKAASKK